MVDFRLFLVLCTILVLVIPIILQYIYGWNVFFWINEKQYNISMYGFYLLGYMFLQFVFAAMNNIKLQRLQSDRRRTAKIIKRTNIMVVGHKEDPEYFRMCLESLKTVSSNVVNLNKIFVIIDGSDSSDKYMVDLFYNVFDNSTKKIFHLQLLESSSPDEVLTLNMLDIQNNDIICISQPHGGKRCAMMTGFRITLLENVLFNTDVDTIFCTDSDTVLTPECITSMYSHFENDNIGAVAGNLGIYNKYDSVVSFMSSIRYWYAFNIERAYQSFTGSVLCVSGPIGMYRITDLEKIIDKWSKQKFLGKDCTYGDDRHLTNQILGLKKNVIYISSSYAETETPSSWYRFFKQQTRWNKSAFREFFWSVAILDKHSLFMTVDLVYVLVYPYVVMSYLMYILWYKTVFELGFYISIVLMLGLIKSVYGTVMSGKYENMFYFAYVFMYVSTVFPAKIWALVNITDNSWGTSSRKIMSTDVSFDIIIPLLWNIILLCGIVYNLWRSSLSGFVFTDYLLLIVVSGILCLCLLVMWLYVTIKRNNRSQYRKVE
mgnify:CR=1 FL=1|jgi:hyaluronan synthase